MSGTFKLGEVELQRADILQACLARRLKNQPAATKLGITVTVQIPVNFVRKGNPSLQECPMHISVRLPKLDPTTA